MELLAVIAMIGILAAASAPSIIYYLRDRRVNDAGTEIANLYRYARARAMGRGSAVNVRYEVAPDALAALVATDPNARFAVREAVVAGIGAGIAATGVADQGDATQGLLGVPHCTNTNWGPGVAGTQYLTAMDERRSRYYPATVSFFGPGGGAIGTRVDICFTPRGRVWFNPTTGFVQMNGVPFVRLQNAIENQAPFGTVQSLVRRMVIIPPTGAARLITELQN